MLPEGQSLSGALKARGVSRRHFVEFCSAMLAILALPDRYLAQVVEAVGKAKKPVLVSGTIPGLRRKFRVHLTGQSPNRAGSRLGFTVLGVSRTHHGRSRKVRRSCSPTSREEEKGKYLAVVEGAIPLADGGVYCTVGGRTAIDLAREVCGNAAASIAVGACAWDGGLVAAKPNPTGAVGLEEAVPGINLINMPGCPQNPANTVAVLVHYLTFGELPAMDQYHRPLFTLRPTHP